MENFYLQKCIEASEVPVAAYPFIQFDKTDGSTATNQIAFDQRDSSTIPEFERTMDRRCQLLVSKLETLVPSLLTNCVV